MNLQHFDFIEDASSRDFTYLCTKRHVYSLATPMPIIPLTDLSHPALNVYARLTEKQLRTGIDPCRSFADEAAPSMSEPMFIAESPKVIHTALGVGLTPVSLLCEARHIEGDAASIIARCPQLPIYTGSRELLSALTGYTLTRGVLCAMRRPTLPAAKDICASAKRICVLHSVSDTTNIGAIFRSAAALGIDAVLLTPDTCDPFNRRAVRVSMGSVFLVPWTYLSAGSIQEQLHQLGFQTAALALSPEALTLDHPQLKEIPRLALIMGTEGDGLPHRVIGEADYVVRIPMAHGVDSLNVAAASAVTFWELRQN